MKFKHPKNPTLVYTKPDSFLSTELGDRTHTTVRVDRVGNGTTKIYIDVELDGTYLHSTLAFSVDDCTADQILSGELCLRDDGLEYAKETD
jgi:hypothetical protein